MSEGTATITAACGDQTATCAVTVTDNAALTLSDPALTLATNSAGTLTATLSGVSDSKKSQYSVVWTSGDETVATVTAETGNTFKATVKAVSKGSAVISAQLKKSDGSTTSDVGSAKTCTVTVGNTLTLGQYPKTTGVNNTYSFINSYWTRNSNGYYYYSIPFEVTPSLNGSTNLSNYDVYYTWTLIPYYGNGSVSSGTTVKDTSKAPGANSYTLTSYWYDYDNYYNYYGYTLRCDVAVYEKDASVSTATPLATRYTTWLFNNGYTSGYSFGSVTVYDSNSGYSLRDTPDEGSTSIADQINSWVRSYYGNNTSYYDYYRVYIAGGTMNANGTSSASYSYGTLTSSTNVVSGGWLTYSQLEDIIFTPRTTVSTATGSYSVSYPVRIRPYYSDNYTEITGYITFNVKQGTASGGDISLPGLAGKDVVFSASDFENFWTDRYAGGYLTSVVFGSTSGSVSGTVYNSNSKTVGSSSYFVNPSGSQNSLDGVYFSPSSSKTGTANIRFTATGQTSSSSNSSYTRTLTGTVIITYLSSSASRITYTTTSAGTVSLSAQDFIDAYKGAAGTTSNPSNLTIQFQDVPTYGTLTYSGGSRNVRLTESNVKNYKFSTRSSGSNQIGDVAYTVSGNHNDTVSYIGYIGSTATFTGEVTFNAITAPTNVSVTYACTSAAGIALTPANFTGANAAMSNAYLIRLGTPRTGSLSYTNGSTANPIPISALSYVTYKPDASVSGTATDTFAFYAYDSNSNLVASGTVTVSISLPVNPNAITSISQFTDVPAAGGSADWYRTSLSFLISRGVISGQGNGKFGPEQEVEYSAALKFIMNAVGIVETEVSTPGVNWAQNYKNRAVSAGWISSNVDLTKPIGRDAMVELAAKALGVPASAAASPFTDTTNQWAVALYNTTPRIITGSNDLNGRLVFEPNVPLRRDAMVCIVYRMYQYVAQNGTQYNSYLNYDET